MGPMGWVRYHKRCGAWLGFAALALQVVLTFGHVHLDRAAHPSAPLAAAVHDAALAQAARHDPAQNPADDGDDYCAICAAIYLASTAAVALPPLLPAPPAFTRIRLSFSVLRESAALRHFAFRSRAPPAI
jgi:hypothetical protein